MAQRELEQRVENIEETLQVLNTLPARVGSLETQFLQFRAEVRAEFSATRIELRAHAEALQKDAIAQARIMHQDLVDRIKTLRNG